MVGPFGFRTKKINVNIGKQKNVTDKYLTDTTETRAVSDAR